MELEVSLEDAVLYHIETLYWKHGTVPTDERVAELMGSKRTPELIAAVRMRPRVQAALRARGVTVDTTVPDGGLTGIQQLAVTMMVNASDRRSERAKLDDLNKLLEAQGQAPVTPVMWNGWKRQPAVQEALRTRARESFLADEFKFHNAVVQGTEERNPALVKMMGQMLGHLDSDKSIQNVNLNLDVHVMVDKLFNVLTEVITDPELLARIGDRLERELDGPVIDLDPETDLTAHEVRRAPQEIEQEKSLVRSLEAAFAETPKSKVEPRTGSVQAASETAGLSQF